MAPDKLLFLCGWPEAPVWREQLVAAGVPLVTPEEQPDWDRVVFAAVWGPLPGLLQKCPSLRGVMSLGAGVDHLLQPGVLPHGVPALRIVDPLMAQRMATWVVWAVINAQRKFDVFAAAQREALWDSSAGARQHRDNGDIRVGVMGLGVMGGATARALQGLGYRVHGWARTQRRLEGAEVFVGRESLDAFLAHSDVLVCLLPLTPDTEGVLNSRTLALLPRGAYVINAARGRHVVEYDLLKALDDGQVGGACLDVFATEPLPSSSPLWRHPHVRITPHVASCTDVQGAVAQIVRNYQRALEARDFVADNLVNTSAGY